MTDRMMHVHGPGKAGVALARMLQARGVKILSLSGGRGVSGGEAGQALAAPWSAEIPTLPAGAWLLLSPPDDALAAEATRLASQPLPAGGIVFHLSAIHGREVLAPLEARGLQTAAFHPLRALTHDAAALKDFGGAMVAVDASVGCAQTLNALALELGGAPVSVTGAQRTAYHLGAALAGNGPIALLELAVEIWTRAGFSPIHARRELNALARMALDNVASHGTTALTGPVQRGDTGTVSRHLAHMRQNHAADAELLREVYAVLLRVAARSDEPGKHAGVARLLGESPE